MTFSVRSLLDWRQWLLLAHRWLGIAGCLLFVAWFLSGLVMIYVRMPELSREERLARAPVLDLSTARLSPSEAAARADLRADRVLVTMRGNRPVYRLGRGRTQTIVFADTGDVAGPAGMDEAKATASRFVAANQTLRFNRHLTEPDQWTLQDRARLPMEIFSADDSAGTEVYVSDATGEAVLRTTRQERVWAYLGPVIHWGYFTAIRRNGPLWSEIIIWSSVLGCVVSVTGLLWGMLRFSPSRRFRISGTAVMSPYAGIMKWHHYAGLLFGLFSLTWVYSGLLSMEPFHWFETTGLTREQREAAIGRPLQIDTLSLDRLRDAVATLSRTFTPRELEAIQFRGETFWAADRAPSTDDANRLMHGGLNPRVARPAMERRYVRAADPATGSFVEFERSEVQAIAHRAMPDVPIADETWLTAYDGYYYDARGSRPLPVLRVRYQDPEATWLYFDPKRGAIVEGYNRTSRLQRWLYHGLHSLDFPFLYFRRPLWDAVMIALSLGGLASSATALLPAWRRVARLFRLRRA